MHIAVPFDIETVKQSWGQAGRMWGRVVANHDFLTALVASGDCSRLTLFVPGRRDVALLKQTLVAGFGSHATKVSVVPYAYLPAHLHAEPVDVMHLLDPNLWLAAHIRGHLAPRPFVITGMTHSLGNQRFLEWALLGSANGAGPDDCLVCTTPTARAVVESAFARLRASVPGFRAPATTVIPLGVATQAFTGSRTESRGRLGLDPDDFVVLSLARFNPRFKMDLRPLLQLASLLGQKGPGTAKFILAGSSGDGDYLRFIRDQCRAAGLDGRIEFMPDPDEARKAQLFRAADVFLSLSDSIQETFGLTVVEAMAAGLPVVASDWDGYRSLVVDGDSGFLVPTKGLAPDASWEALLALRYDALVHLFGAQSTAVDLDVACERLMALAGDPALRERMGTAARARARLFDWPVVIAQYVALWQRLLAARAAGPPATTVSSALRFVADFMGYASSRLEPADRFRITPAGQSLLDSNASVPLYFETDEFLDRQLMGRILRHCVDARSVAQLGALEQGGSAPSPVRLGQNILWLYKYGYLRLL